ncbi:WYL domain-containing protein, partial [Streptomyces sp. NPDC059101]|uniref:WYL domain-containing protein n=1 Tax=Streptomyces sp. NPDC059101 TaxID=3346728 RepID=UPI0036B547CC
HLALVFVLGSFLSNHDSRHARGPRARQASAAAPDADGWTRVVVPIESYEQALPKLLLLGVGAEVVGPPELRERMRATLAEMLARYEGDGPTQE